MNNIITLIYIINISNLTEYDDDNGIISFDTSAGTTYIFNKI